ncbi:MAG: replication-associated recombination protein A [Candidatus Doudnabacteria bacterium]|nr:replication-associated recombination protein A [Candidatus Doudnabacteria bacterium]
MEPLASKLRPTTLNAYVGQAHLVGPGKPLNLAIGQKHLFSFILWGPPGVGKTTLARIYAKAVNAEYHELSAVSAGKEDIRKIVDKPSMLGQPKILFLDEIHRFNKAQQDFLLPHVENGKLYIIGATTENPSFEIIPALISRCRVFVLNELTPEEMKQIITTALSFAKNDPLQNSREPSSVVTDAVDLIVQMSGGDARQALTLLDNTFSLHGKVTTETLKNTFQSKTLRYDKNGEEHYNTISAFIKSMRASNTNAALYYLARMLESGEDPLFIARRMVIFASEDIGLAQPTALVVTNAVFEACQKIGYPECAINLAHGTCYLSQCKKDRSSYDAYFKALDDAKTYGNLPIPLYLRNAPTKLLKDLGYGKSYEMYPETEDYLPDELKGKTYF